MAIHIATCWERKVALLTQERAALESPTIQYLMRKAHDRFVLEGRWSPTDAALAYYLTKSSSNDEEKAHYRKLRVAPKTHRGCGWCLLPVIVASALHCKGPQTVQHVRSNRRENESGLQAQAD